MSLGVTEILVILLIVLIIFGAGKLPSVMGDLGKGIRSFKSGLKDEPAEAPLQVSAHEGEQAAPGASVRSPEVRS
ncbi:twin-arginine translocase TatA/TatE family subunit [Arenibaculum pallidiluteum]|uniref:twin-arginine translocase TatA/TatE family subunit n=1 Tax=Arenibaculum pallidiluteum TaxID=2812559 RepID=UPI001A97671C|nr:twin-arginine translocase TatA/TatE family subunit [Arenibaculum pallidiluteum]